jgi:SsrA-binding protein
MIILTNKKAYHDYEILDKYTAGIKLLGYEAKSLREKGGRLEGSYVKDISGNLKLVNFYIKRYSKVSQKIEDTDLSRTRDLLLNKREILKIRAEISQKGKSCVPLNLRIDHGLFKIEIGVVRGRREYEKKVVAQRKEEKRDMERDRKVAGTWA